MKSKSLVILILSLMNVTDAIGQQKMEYKTVKNDPLKARIYTLKNGLKVYLSVNKDEPRIQTFVGVRVGSKDDPAETTGLAHYFEHMMFKGTPNFGTTNWKEEQKLIAEIEALFQEYRSTTDEAKRNELYKVIDQKSFEASKLAIPNEYDKLMTAIGASGTNAATGNDYTYYVENIPSNQIENWAKIQTDRFTTPILRLFHTELETVYEEKNMSLTNDGRRANEAMLSALFPNHPYGLQTTLGHPEHLKNPSMTEINKFFNKYYVANNLCISMSGDFDYDTTIQIIDKYFGTLKPGNAPKFEGKPLPAMNEVITKEIVGQEAENVTIAFRIPGNGTLDNMKANLLAMVLSNQKAGLIDLNINQKQKAVGAGAYVWGLNDHGVMVLSGRNKANQSLEEVKNLLIEQLEICKAGKFEDWLLGASINNLKLREINRFEDNRGRATAMAMSFMNRLEWEDVVNYNQKLATITKKDLVDFANKYLQNYAIIYKKQGKATDIPIVEKPAITPIHINRDAKSDFLKNIETAKVADIKPVFLDYKKDFTQFKTKNGVPVMYKKNTTNPLFNLVYYFPFGTDNDNKINMASSYLSYLGTSKLTPEQVKQEFFKLACSFSVSASRDQTYISLSGLSENQDKAIALLEQIINDAQPNETAWQNLVKDMLKSRKDNKANQRSNFATLTNYGLYGTDSPSKNIVSEKELKELKPQDIVNIIKDLPQYAHEILYYGTNDVKKLDATLTSLHKVPAKFTKTIAPAKIFKVEETKENKVLFAHYEGPQSMVQSIIKGGDYNNAVLPTASIYNEYFGGGMNAIVFQELREKRGLAYSAWARYATPSTTNEAFRNISFIQTQNDKVIEALTAFNDLFNNMPQSEASFNLAKESMMKNIATERITDMDIIWSYLSDRKMGRDYDNRKVMYETLPKLTMKDVIDFNQKNIQNKSKTYVILGNEKLLNFEELEKQFGKVEKLKMEDYFGY